MIIRYSHVTCTRIFQFPSSDKSHTLVYPKRNLAHQFTLNIIMNFFDIEHERTTAAKYFVFPTFCRTKLLFSILCSFSGIVSLIIAMPRRSTRDR